MKNGYDDFFKKLKGKETRIQKTLASKPETKRNKPKNFPLVPALILSFFAGFLIFGNVTFSSLDKYISKLEVSLIGASVANETTPLSGKKDSKDSSLEAKTSAGSKETKPAVEVEKETWTPEEIALFKKLDDRKRALDERESEISKMEEELQKQKKELQEKIGQLEQLRNKIAATLDEKVKGDGERVEKLVAFYSNMKPQSAAKVIQDMNEDLAVEILGKMKQKSAAEILNLISSDKAQKLSEKFAGYKRK